MAVPITVGMRMRPLVPREAGQLHCLVLHDNQVSVVDAVVSKGNDVIKGGPKEFAFDHSMDSSDPSSDSYVDQEKCYAIMGQPMLSAAMEGFNTCLFCYGQTGTGKTTTIMGEPEPVSKQGLLMRLLYELFQQVAKLEEEGTQVLTQVQMLEVYNEELRDLIVAKKDKEDSKVKISVTPRQGAQLVGATEAMVPSFKDTVKLLDYGNSNKTIAATAMNPQSSRGHTVFRLNVTRKGSDGATVSSSLYFADLAGAENQKTTLVTGDRLKELTFINRSLMFLAQAIQALTQRKSNKTDMSIFRNSKLTLLLSNALIGNSRTSMIGTLSPALLNFEESYKTLKFASAVKSIKIEASVAASLDPAVMVKKLQEEVKELKAQLKKGGGDGGGDGGDGGGSSSKPSEELQLQLAALQELVEKQRRDWGEIQKEAEEQAKLRDEIMTAQVISRILGPERAADKRRLDEAVNYCHQILQGMPGNDHDLLHAFLRSTLKARQLVEQANTLTAEVKPKSGLCFELAFTSQVLGHGEGPMAFPELCVRVLRTMSVARMRWRWAVDCLRMRTLAGVVGRVTRLAEQDLAVLGEKGEQKMTLLYHWSWSKFLDRLACMHKLHAKWAVERPPEGLTISAVHDPWIELESETQQQPMRTIAMDEPDIDAQKTNLMKRKSCHGVLPGLVEGGLQSNERDNSELMEENAQLRAEIEELRSKTAKGGDGPAEAVAGKSAPTAKAKAKSKSKAKAAAEKKVKEIGAEKKDKIAAGEKKEKDEAAEKKDIPASEKKEKETAAGEKKEKESDAAGEKKEKDAAAEKREKDAAEWRAKVDMDALRNQKVAAEDKLRTAQEQMRDLRKQLKDAQRETEMYRLEADAERDRNEKLLADMDELDRDNLELVEECEMFFEENKKLRQHLTGESDEPPAPAGGVLGWMFGGSRGADDAPHDDDRDDNSQQGSAG